VGVIGAGHADNLESAQPTAHAHRPSDRSIVGGHVWALGAANGRLITSYLTIISMLSF